MSSSDLATKARGLPEEVHGIAPLDLDKCSKDALPPDWEVTGTFGDILMCEYADLTRDEHQDTVRNGIVVPKGMIQYMWRVVQVKMKGPQASDNVEVGDYLMIPSGKGIPGVGINGEKLLFINEERMFCKVKPREIKND